MYTKITAEWEHSMALEKHMEWCDYAAMLNRHVHIMYVGLNFGVIQCAFDAGIAWALGIRRRATGVDSHIFWGHGLIEATAQEHITALHIIRTIDTFIVQTYLIRVRKESTLVYHGIFSRLIIL